MNIYETNCIKCKEKLLIPFNFDQEYKFGELISKCKQEHLVHGIKCLITINVKVTKDGYMCESCCLEKENLLLDQCPRCLTNVFSSDVFVCNGVNSRESIIVCPKCDKVLPQSVEEEEEETTEKTTGECNTLIEKKFKEYNTLVEKDSDTGELQFTMQELRDKLLITLSKMFTQHYLTQNNHTLSLNEQLLVRLCNSYTTEFISCCTDMYKKDISENNKKESKPATGKCCVDCSYFRSTHPGKEYYSTDKEPHKAICIYNNSFFDILDIKSVMNENGCRFFRFK